MRVRSLLLPEPELKNIETSSDVTARLILTEELKNLLFGTVWQEFCERHDVPNGLALSRAIEGYRDSVSEPG